MGSECQKYVSGDYVASIFFAKHCVVKAFLKLQEPGYAAIVIDADVVPAVLERGVEQWLETGSDIHLYERLVIKGVAAGNYLVRNTPWALKFLHEWAEKAFKIPKGYSSYDNGSLHLLLVETLHLAQADRCKSLYDGLDVSMDTWEEKGQNLTSYMAFIACAIQAIGPPR